MHETRHQFREDLRELEHQVLGGLDLVVIQLDRAQESLTYQDVELAQMVIVDDDRIDGRYLEVHQGILSLLARQAPVAGDLRTIAALLHIARCMERMGDQCVNIAKLVPLSGYESPKDKEILDAIQRMGHLTRAQLVQARDALRLRDTSLAQGLATQDAEINQINRTIFRRAVEIGALITTELHPRNLDDLGRCLAGTRCFRSRTAAREQLLTLTATPPG